MGDSAMVCDSSVGGEGMRTAECIEEFGATKRLDEKSDVKFTFRIVATGSVQAVDGLFNAYYNRGHTAATFERNSENAFEPLDIV